MITITTRLDSKSSYPIEKPFTQSDIVFFDIETTGFSARTSYLYLIGCMYYKEDAWYILQWLADNMTEERQLLEEFLSFLKNYKRLIHFNGTTFDIPYIQQKCSHHGLEFPFNTMESYDIYKKILPFKKLFSLENYKLKTLEKYLGFKREDTYSGGELIQIYANYVGRKQYEKLHKKTKKEEIPFSQKSMSTPLLPSPHIDTIEPASKEPEKVLLLHNLEDIKGLQTICNILFITDLFEKGFGLKALNMCEPTVQNEIASFYRIELSLDFISSISLTLRTPLTEFSLFYNETFLELSIIEDKLILLVPVFTGELKFFYENYRDYYYLPKEDTAIHKSVAEYVDKEFRIKAKPATCYLKKSGKFLPQPKIIYSPNFKGQFADKLTFFELKKELTQSDNFKEYIYSWLQYISKNKDTSLISRGNN